MDSRNPYIPGARADVSSATKDPGITHQLNSKELGKKGAGIFDSEGTTTAFHLLALDWKTLKIAFNNCEHTLELEATDNDTSQVKCKGVNHGVVCSHNKSVMVPTRLLHQMSPDALMRYCLDQEKRLVGGTCQHNNSSKKLVVSIENKLCVEQCTKTLACGHPCRNLCHEDCSTCEELVAVSFEDCEHVNKVKCFELSNRKVRECKVLVQLEDPAGCGHIVSIPCNRRQKATYEELMEACTAACSYTGPCRHKCTGTCKGCYQGRFHVRCSHRCDRTLDCGHRCDGLCCSQFTNSVCPPCRKPCEASCEHGRCNRMCGIPCKPCMEPCTWKCPHFQCTKLCSEPCDREMCNSPCEKLLGCGCPCIGYCGEPCPPICRNCNKDTLNGLLLSGKEVDELGEDDRFIFLENCKHTLEYSVLEKIMNMDTESEPSGRLKTCPLCRGVIWSCRPFNTQVLERRKKFLDAKELRYGPTETINAVRLECYYKLNVSDRRDGHQNCRFNDFRIYLLGQFIVDETFLPIPKDQMQQIASLTEAYRLAETRTIRLHKLMVERVVEQASYGFYLQLVQRLFECLITRQLPMLPSEGQDFLREMDRIQDLVHLITSPRGPPSMAEDSDYLDAYDVLEDPGAYTRRLRVEFHQRFRRHWLKFCCSEPDKSRATLLYEVQMGIQGLKIDWLEPSPE